MLKIPYNKKIIEIINVKNIGIASDVKLIQSTLSFDLSDDYLQFLNNCQYANIKKNNEQLVIYDPLTLIHENSIDILNNMDKQLEFLCIGKYVKQDKYLVYKNGNDGYAIYDNENYVNKKLATTIKDFLNR